MELLKRLLGAGTGLLKTTLPGPMLLWEVLVVGLLMLALVTFGFVKGINHEQAKNALAANKQLVRVIRVGEQSKTATNQSYAVLEAKIKRLDSANTQLLKGIKDHVSISDSKCDLSTGWVLLHNWGSSGTVPGAAKQSDQNPSGVTAATALEQAILPNYLEYNKCREQVIEFNDWYVTQKKIYDQK